MGIAIHNSSSQQSLNVATATAEGDIPQPGAPEAESTPDTQRRVARIVPGIESSHLHTDDEGEVWRVGGWCDGMLDSSDRA